MKNLFDAELEIIQFDVNDIITTSNEIGDIDADEIW